MAPTLCRVAFLCAFIIPAASVAADDIIAGEYGQRLRENLRRKYSPTTVESYNAARVAMFSRIDNVEGAVTCVYTGVTHRTTGIPNSNVINTEHTWPQSQFKRASNAHQMKADLHHLYVTVSVVNGARGNLPFAEIPDGETDMWWISAEGRRGIPTSRIDDYSESVVGAFEPRERHKGNVARSLFYFFTMYEDRGINLAWFRPQIATLLAWHAQDPADDEEVKRSRAIAELQGNENPFVLDKSLPDRIFRTNDRPLGPLFANGFNLARARPAGASLPAGDQTTTEQGKSRDALVEENALLRQMVVDLHLEIARLKKDKK